MSPVTINEFEADSYHILEASVRDDLYFYIVSHPASLERPGNGGLRLLQYAQRHDTLDEAKLLCRLMSHKHALYNTGFSGAKIVACGDPRADKRPLLDAVAHALERRQGLMYTGCDLNIGDIDMNYLADRSPFVLSSVDSPVDPSVATGRGVLGSLYGTLDAIELDDKPLTFLVHGVGKTGRVVADHLAAAGHRVLTYDVDAARADRPGCTNMSHRHDWWTIPCDGLILCSVSHVIDATRAAALRCQLIVSSANGPFKGHAVYEILRMRGIHWVPDAMSNAGAVICDSVEHHFPHDFVEAQPEPIYRFVQALIKDRTRRFMLEHRRTGRSIRALMRQQLTRNPGEHLPCCGALFAMTAANANTTAIATAPAQVLS